MRHKPLRTFSEPPTDTARTRRHAIDAAARAAHASAPETRDTSFPTRHRAGWFATGGAPDYAIAPVRFWRRPIGQWLRNGGGRSEEHTSELKSLMRISYAVFCLK